MCEGRPEPRARASLSYGSAWGAALGIVAGSLRLPVVPASIAVGTAIWLIDFGVLWGAAKQPAGQAVGAEPLFEAQPRG